MASDGTGQLRCALGCWAMGVLAGGLATVMLQLLGGFSWPGAVFSGAVLTVAVGLFLTATICRPLPSMRDIQARSHQPAPVAHHHGMAEAAAPFVPAPAPAVAPVPAPVVAEVPAPADGGTQPVALAAARNGQPDDLKEIKGVGPKLEQLLHRLGIFHFDQIAAWKAPEIAWMDDNLEGFRGRVTRDGWVDQARILAAGGETEHSRAVERGEAT